MLQLILGRSGSGKTEYVFSQIKKLVENGELKRVGAGKSTVYLRLK